MPEINIIDSPVTMAYFVGSIVDRFNDVKMLPFYENEMDLLTAEHARYFERAAGPDGQAWAPNAAATIRRKRHSRVLFGVPSQGFRLSKSLTQHRAEFAVRRVVDDWPAKGLMVFGTDAPYHAYNEFGTSKIPARRHVGITEQYLEQLTERAVDYVFAQIKLNESKYTA